MNKTWAWQCPPADFPPQRLQRPARCKSISPSSQPAAGNSVTFFLLQELPTYQGLGLPGLALMDGH